MQGLEDVEVVDGEPVAASLIARAVTAGKLLFDDGATQTFDVNGDTSYVEADGRPTQGKWYVDEDGRFCSFWPPTYLVEEKRGRPVVEGATTPKVPERQGFSEAGDGGRTRDLRLGKPTLCQLSYTRAGSRSLAIRAARGA